MVDNGFKDITDVGKCSVLTRDRVLWDIVIVCAQARKVESEYAKQ